MFNANLGNLLEKVLACLRMSEYPSLCFDEELAAATLYHVAEKGPRRPAEANQWNTALQLVPGHGYGLVDIIQLLGNVNFLFHDCFILAVSWRRERLGEMRSLLVNHLNSHAHSLWNDKDVRKYYGGVNEASEALNWLQG